MILPFCGAEPSPWMIKISSKYLVIKGFWARFSLSWSGFAQTCFNNVGWVFILWAFNHVNHGSASDRSRLQRHWEAAYRMGPQFVNAKFACNYVITSRCMIRLNNLIFRWGFLFTNKHFTGGAHPVVFQPYLQILGIPRLGVRFWAFVPSDWLVHPFSTGVSPASHHFCRCNWESAVLINVMTSGNFEYMSLTSGPPSACLSLTSSPYSSCESMAVGTQF